MDRVSSEFYKNVQLLTQFVAPHDDFKKYFKEGMFDKPNTLGFIHVSYYLLNVHCKDKPKVQWPVICKQTENKFRNDVRECLMSIASENPDVNFPPIFASHLLLARGNKFLLIMWKFSLVVLRSYLKSKCQCNLAANPKQGPCSDLTKVFLTSVAEDNNNVVSNIRQEKDNVQKEAADFLKKKTDRQNVLKTEILNAREELKRVISEAPVNAAAKKNLLVTEVNEIIKMWAGCINDILKNLETEVESLNDEYKFLNSIANIVSIVKGDLAVLSTKSLDPINLDPVYQLVPPEMQLLSYSLYSDKSLNLHNFFAIFVFLLEKLEARRGKNEADQLSVCKSQLETSNRDLKLAIGQFENLLEDVDKFQSSEVKKIDDPNDTQKIISNVPEFDRVLFTSSPSIHINSAQGGSNFNPTYLQLTPVEGVHKELFSRHIISNEDALSAKKPLHVQRINFDDSMIFDSSKLDPNVTIDRQHLLRNRAASKNVDKYSKIFSTRSRKHDNKANKSIMNMMLPLMAKQHNISLIDSCNSSRDNSQNSLLINPNLSSTIDTPKGEDRDKDTSKSRQKRRSISDLVERYKKLLQERESK